MIFFAVEFTEHADIATTKIGLSEHKIQELLNKFVPSNFFNLPNVIKKALLRSLRHQQPLRCSFFF